MRVLNFNVNGQKLKKSPLCDFSHIIIGSRGYLSLKFDFDEDWDDYLKFAVFSTDINLDNSSVVCQEKLKNNSIDVPNDIIKNKIFYVSLFGVKGSSVITTNGYKIKQEDR